ncbi:MAG: class I SAM-dependent methyltransferase [Holophagae bacterium]|jgi:SAM-dependent methyltransferase
MDLSDPTVFALFLEIYGTLPRAGPGSTADTHRALDLVPTRPIRTVLDLGCGPGAQTLALAEALPGASIRALDVVPEMVAEANRRIADAGLEHRVRAARGDMMDPGVSAESQDLIWCEGAIYFAGIENALRTWGGLLTENGSIAFTEPVWITPSPPDELVSWWREEYPAITDEGGVRDAIMAAGYATVGQFVLPADSWWDDYYRPMELRLAEFTASHRGDPVAREIAVNVDREIEMFKRYHGHYSYGFFVVRPVADLTPRTPETGGVRSRP